MDESNPRKASRPRQRSEWKRTGHTVLRLSFGVGILGVVLWEVDLHAALRTLVSARPDLVLAACLAFAADRALMAYKWNLLLRAKGIRIPFVEALRLYTSGNLIGLVTPGAIGLDVYRIAALSSLHRAHDVAATAILERLVGLAALALITLAALPQSIEYLPSLGDGAVWGLVVICAFGIAGTFVAMSPKTNARMLDLLPIRPESRLGRALRRTLQSYNDAAADRRSLVRFSAWTVVEVLLFVAVVFLAARALDVRLPFSFFAVMTPTILLLSRLPITLDGLGVTETMYVVTLVSVGYAEDYGLALAILVRVIRLAVAQIPAAVWFMMSRSGSPPASRTGSSQGAVQ